MKRLFVALAVVVMLPLTAGPVHAESKASGPFRIAKIRYEQGATLNSEYVVVKNITQRRHTLKGYRMVDPLDGQTYTFPKTIVKPGGIVTLHTGRGRDTAGHRYWGQDEPMWNNDGDTALLTKPGGGTVDRCLYQGDAGGTATC